MDTVIPVDTIPDFDFFVANDTTRTPIRVNRAGRLAPYRVDVWSASAGWLRVVDLPIDEVTDSTHAASVALRIIRH